MITLSPLAARAAGLDPFDAEVLTIAEYAGLLGRSTWTVYRWRSDEPELLPPSVVVGGRVYFPVRTVVQFRPPSRPSMRGKWPRGAKPAALAVINAARAKLAH